ncbi:MULTISPECIES: ABC transporter ATP-binding protein [unclassified Cobetia]|uniref:ABC transporter ATP-binding protein n=1 Tax=unclassified Cobetia TaxID=2609414 RepID=UPI00178CC5AD|nr:MULTISPECIES: ATP-binding cassette domain-containing protein [unclassified Cobetia]MBE2168717.1 ATP-binding cassette domain-containing protein [Cobetia sp. 2AS1]MDH2447715.1 ATP-binding cassette domain-containing protein [Cobetia sp. 2AS]
MFTLDHLRFDLGERCLLKTQSLDFAPGQVHGLIGHNGSGKSTLLKLLARQNTPTSGKLALDYRPLSQFGSREFARAVAYLPQHLPAAEALTGRELVAFGRYPWHGLLGRPGPKDEEAIERAIALTHTEAFAEQQVDTLSGGERQRVWLAMLLAQGSRYLLLDEPLAALDIAHQIEVMELVSHLSHTLGLGIIIVLHDINLAARYCDRLVALHGGQVLAEGAPDAMMNPVTLKDIYGVEMQVITSPQSQQQIAVPL